MTLQFKELAGSPVEVYGPSGAKAERHLLCAFEDRHAVVTALLCGECAGGRAAAAYPGFSAIIARSVRIEPCEKRPDNQGTFDDLASDLNSYSAQFVEVVVDYELPPGGGSHPNLPQAQGATGTHVVYRQTVSDEYASLASHNLQWQSSPQSPVPAAGLPSARVPITDHHLIWHGVVNPPWAALRDLLGMVNDATFLGAEPETVLFDGAQVDSEFLGINANGEPLFAWQIHYVFREKRQKLLTSTNPGGVYGWNHAYRPESSDGTHWDRLQDASGNQFYCRGDFGRLFDFR